MKLDSREVTFHPLSYGDRSGRVFWWNGGLYRGISFERLSFYRSLIDDGVIDNLIQKQLLIQTESANIELDGYGLVLKHYAVPFVSYCYEWCGEMLKAAAALVLRLESTLQEYGLTLHDPHPVNVVFQGTRPLWVDLGSIMPMDCSGDWASDMFTEQFTRPLQIMSAGYEHIARCLLYDVNIRGIQQQEVDAFTRSTWSHINEQITQGAKVAARSVTPGAFRPIAHRVKRYASRHYFRKPATTFKTVDTLAVEIENIAFPRQHTRWSNYDQVWFPDFDVRETWTDKHRCLLQILSTTRPKSVLDIGSNRGWYSQLAGRTGAEVVAVDSDEPAVAKLFVDAVRGSLPILPLVTDFRALHPGLALKRSPGIAPAERMRCDMVFALALVHHLVFTQSMNFDTIVEGLGAFTRRWLVTEFVGRDDRHIKDWIDGWPTWYTLENFQTALQKRFSRIEVFPSNEEHRRILLCE